MDVFILEYSRSMASIIEVAEAGEERRCDIIAQDAPTTINSGFLIFRMSLAGERIIEQWLEVMIENHYKGIFWQEDQGWLQYVYLKSVESHLKKQCIFDCIAKSIHENTPNGSGGGTFNIYNI